ncbi:hypothetical protein HR060_05370 [Catenovulum sp. SM1970]|uniref:hypothetical protein n=1 Tax=Marinifaba aquimaris TaxID=2741323 RepID=UPI001571CEFA|nr:hypothetical protein [Marinifaba aquimaris]NTS76293.1 hypothetical protein [Marinifaba aquimaris]
MKRLTLALMVLMLSACVSVEYVTPYDPVIDNGIREYKESINTLAKNLGDQAGTEAGTYEANLAHYNALESKIDLLIERANLQSAGRGCRLAEGISAQLAKVAPEPMIQTEEGDSYGCTERLLVLVKDQLDLLQNIHQSADKCNAMASPRGTKISCLRATTSKAAMKITNQSINAVWVVETAKKNGDNG